MPRNVDPGSIKVGKGLAPEGTVEDNSLRYPERDADPLRVHIHDPSRAHMASSIGIVDANDCYVSDEVEGALQELCSNSGAGRLNGLIAGGTFTELACAPNGTAGGVHATLTLCAPTEIMMNGTVLDAAGLTVSLPAVNTIYFIYLDTQVTSPSYRELVATTVGPPQVEEGDPDATTGPGSIEQVMLAKVVVDGAGNITAWQDARFFVRNLDRKVQYSSRQGENVDAWSEGCFANLQAFFFWAEFYGDGALASSNEEEKGTVLIRGTHTITSGTFTVPTNHLQFVGDGEAVLQWNAVGAPGDIITMVDKSDVTFRNLTFIANVAGCRGIVATGNYSDITVEDCRFLSGTGSFSTAMSFTGGPANVRTLVRDCYVEATASGVTLDGMGSTSSYGAQVQDTVIQGTGIIPSIGITLGTGGTLTGGVHITGCMITDMQHGIQADDCGSTWISRTAMKEVANGIIFNTASAAATEIKISDCAIVLSDNVSQYGIAFSHGYKDISIKNCSVENLLAGGHALAPVGIYIRAGKGNEAINAVVEGNTVLGFYDDVGNVGSGIHILGWTTTGYGATVTGNTLGRCGITVDAMMAVTVTGNILAPTGGSSLPSGPTAGALLWVRGCRDFTVSSNTVDGDGTVPEGITLAVCEDFTVSSNTVRRCTAEHIWGTSASSLYAAAHLRDFTIAGNTVDGFLGQAPPTARGIRLSGADSGCPEEGLVDANVVRRCADGILLEGYNASILMEGITASNNLVADCAHGQDVQNNFNFAQAGTKAIGLVYTASMVISGNQITGTGKIKDDAGIPVVFPDDVYPLGIYTFNTTATSIEGNTINGSLSQGNGFSRMVLQVIGSSGADFASEGVSLQGNTIVFNDSHLPSSGAGIVLIGSDTAFIHLFGRHSIDGNTITAAKNIGVGGGILCRFLDGTATEGLSVSRNTVERYNLYGIRMETSSAATLTQALVDTRIRDNQLAPQGNTALAAISVDLVAAQADFIFHDNDITGNTVSAGYGDGISLECAATAAGRMSLDTFSVSGNRIAHLQGAGAVATRGVVAAFVGASYFTGSVLATPGLTRFGVNDNEVRDCTEGINLIFGEVPHVEHLSINNNRITATGEVGKGVLSVSMAPLTGVNSEMRFTTIHDNAVEVPFANALIGGLGLDLQNCVLDALSINNNQIGTSGMTDSGEQSPAIRIFNRVLGAPASQSTISNVLVQGNLVGGPINVRTDGNVDGKLISINNNHVSIPASNVPQDSAVLVLFKGGDAAVLLEALQVNGNDIGGGNHSISLRVDDCNLHGISLNSNQTRGAHSTGTGISLLADQSGGTTTSVLREVSISDNRVASNGKIGVHCMSGNGGDLSSFVVANNQISWAAERGIWLQAGGGITALQVAVDEAIVIDSNVLSNCAYAVAALPTIEVSRDPSAGTTPGSIQGLSISGNNLTQCGAENGAIGIYADLTAWLESDAMKVDDNTITDGVLRRMGSGIELDLPNITSLSVSRNDITVEGFDGTSTGNGIYLQIYGDEVNTVSMDDNTIQVKADADHGIRCRGMSDIDFEILNFSISRNKVYGARPHNGYGIRWDGEPDVDVDVRWVNMVWNDNLVEGLQVGIVFTPGRSTSQDWHSYVKNCSFDGNTISDCLGEGLTYNTGSQVFFGGKADSCHGLSVSRNSVVTQYWDLGGMTDRSLIKVHHNLNLLTTDVVLAATNLHVISIDDNHCYVSGVPAEGDPSEVDWGGLDIELGCRGKWDAVNGYADPGSMSNISVDRNTVRNVSYSGVRLHLFGNFHNDIGQERIDEVSKVRNLSVCHNSVLRYEKTASGSASLDLALFGTVANVFVLQGNMTYDSHTAGVPSTPYRAWSIQAEFGVATAWDPALQGNKRWSVQGNIVRAPDPGYEVIYITGFAGGTVPLANSPIPVKGIVTGNSNKACLDVLNDFANAGGFWAFGVNANNLNT